MKPLTITLVAFLTAAPLAALADGVTPLEDCEVLARVNGEVVLACEIAWEAELMVRKQLEGVPPQQRDQVTPETIAQLKQGVMEQLMMGRLDMTLFYADFRATMPQANLESIQGSLSEGFEKQELPKLMKRLGAKDRADLEAKLYELGTSIDERREDFYKMMIARSWLTETTKFDREVTHDDMLEYYQEHAADYATPNRAKWEELMVRFDRHPNKQAAYAAIAGLGNQVYTASQKTAPSTPTFAATAKASSHGFTAAKGGQHGWTTSGALAAKEVDAAIFSLPPGQMSPILEGPMGFHIVRVLEREPAGKRPFRDVQASIRKKIRDERFNDAIQERVTSLKRGARIWTAFSGDIDTSRVATKPGASRK